MFMWNDYVQSDQIILIVSVIRLRKPNRELLLLMYC